MSDAHTPDDNDDTERVEERDVISQSRQQDIAQARSRIPEARLRAKQRKNDPQYPNYGVKQAELEYRTAIEGYVLELLGLYRRNGQLPELWEETADNRVLATVQVDKPDPLRVADRLLEPGEKSFIYQNRYDVPPIKETNFGGGVIAVLPGLKDLLDEQKRYTAPYDLTFDPRNGADFTRSTVISEVLSFGQLDKAVTWADQYAQEVDLGLELGTPEEDDVDDNPY